MSVQIQSTRQLYTRHIALIMAGIMNSALGGISLLSGHLPDWTQYIETNILPVIAFFADFINARIKDYLNKGPGDAFTQIITNMSLLQQKVQQLEQAIKNFPVK